MRFGVYYYDAADAETYVGALKRKGCRAAYCPEYLKTSYQREEIAHLRQVCAREDIVIAEVGAWVNPLSPIPGEAGAARAYIADRLRLADALHARCCVNIIGSHCAESWCGYHPDNFTRKFFDEAVDLYQSILDEVAPTHTTLAFEIMPFGFLDDPENYLSFLEALDRPAAAVHLDPANLLNAPRLLLNHREVIDHAIRLLGPRIVSVHLKDLHLSRIPFNTRIDEVAPGTGELDLRWLLKRLCALGDDLPVMLEHLDSEAEYDRALARVRGLLETDARE